MNTEWTAMLAPLNFALAAGFLMQGVYNYSEAVRHGKFWNGNLFVVIGCAGLSGLMATLGIVALLP